MKKMLRLLCCFTATLLAVGCTDADDNLQSMAAAPQEIIAQDSETFSLLKNHFEIIIENPDIACVQLQYPFGILLYHPGNVVYDIQTVYNENGFVNLIDNLPADASISISYPIRAVNENGQLVAVNSTSELKASLLSCERQYTWWQGGQFFGSDPGASPTPCSLFTIYNTAENGTNQYVGSYFDMRPDYTVTFYYNDIVRRGSWVRVWIENEVHININLEGQDAITDYWNHSFKYMITQDNGALLTFENKSVRLQRVCEKTTEYTVGARGPLGGTVFYDKGSYTNGWRYIELSTQEYPDYQWGCSAASVALAEDSVIGKGLVNTGAINSYFDSLTDYYTQPSVCNNTANGTVAAKKATERHITTYGWFLPSANELKMVYENLKAPGLVSFAGAVYWSSTQESASVAKAVDFTTGEIIAVEKEQADVHTRAVHYF